MNKPKFQCFMAILCTVVGLLLLILTFCIPTFSPTTSTLLVAFSSILIGIGGIAFSIYFKDVRLVAKLKNKQIPILAHWTYSPLQMDTLKITLLEDRNNSFSLIILFGILCLLLNLGFVLTNAKSYWLLSALIGILIIIFCIVTCIGIQLYYNFKSNHPVEAIISEKYIYFSGELHGLNRSFYVLEQVKVLEDDPIFLQFVYGSPGTPYDPIFLLTLPVPSEDLELALQVQGHYMNLISTCTESPKN